MDTPKRLLLLLLLFAAVQFGCSIITTSQQDAAALRALMNEIKSMPPSWGQSDDPCGEAPWDGVTCNNSRVIKLKLYNMGLEGTLSSDIGSLTELQILDLSYNKKLGGTLTAAVGKLKKLASLILIGCNFNGLIPDVLGDLDQLSFLALNSNQFSGVIPSSLGKLSKLNWLDLAENQLSGSLPISTETSPGLDQLFSANHFHLNMNQLSGPIPDKLFSSKLSLLHLLLDRNKFSGSIPASIGSVKTLTVVRLDNNFLNDSVPSSINHLTNLKVLSLANNMLTGPMPNLTGINDLNSVDLSNNSFDPSQAPAWISKLGSLTSLVIESGGLYGQVPQILFSFPYLEKVILKNNRFNGSLDMGSNISHRLQVVNFQNNALTSVELSSNYNNTIIMSGNPVCSNIHLLQTSVCSRENESPSPSSDYCDPRSCPQERNCSHPYEGMMVFRAPFFQDVTDTLAFESLRNIIWQKYNSSVGSISLQNPFFDGNSYLQVELQLCPARDVYFNRTEILVELDLSSQVLRPPFFFGPYYFSASPYIFPGGKSTMSKGLIVALAIGCTLLVIGLFAVGMYAFRQKKRAQRALEISNPFASWEVSEDTGDAPQLKGARYFSFDDLKKCTNNFPKINEIGSGGYGKVYRGMLPDGQIVAIKRAQIGSNQGGLEFKTEIELLSRVHHINLVGLVGFCFDQGERMLVYEYISNGTLRECLSGKSGIQLDWNRRLQIALGSARGLAYLHEHAYPPIVHRDIKSTNILLDERLNAKVADFGLSKILLDRENGDISTQVKGTLGYLDPEYYMTQILTEKSDVYSFGVVMLELVTSRPPIHNGKYIVREVKTAIDESEGKYFGLKNVMDPLIRDAKNLVGFRVFVELALKCVEESSEDRPAMNDVVKQIEMILKEDESNTKSMSAHSSIRGFHIDKIVHPHDYSDSSQGIEAGSSSFGSFLFSANNAPNTR